MLNKIDEKIFDKITMQRNNIDDFDVIVHSANYNNTKCFFDKNNFKYYELPFISSFAINLTCKDIFNIANQNSISYISSDTKVNSLIFDSKKFLGVDQFNERTTRISNHSCVVIDTGIYPHIDFCLGKNRIVEFVDLINNESEMYDDNGHGTFVAGVLAGNSITSKYSGVDTNTNIIVIKALDGKGETTSIKILQAMQWIIENKEKYNIKVVCMSFGSILNNVNDPLIRGVEVLWDNGICVVCAGGNNGPNSETIMSPGGSQKVITVGSLDDIKLGAIKVADFSSRGPVFNYYKPDMVVPGVDIISTNIFTVEKKFYTKMSGTSVSTPMVAGIVSLFYNINSEYSPDQIKYMLIKSCVKISGDKNAEGFGYVNLRNILL